MSNYLWTHGLQHARPTCPSPSSRVCPSPCPLNFPSYMNGSDDKESACSAGDMDSIPGSGISFREGNGNLLQYSCQNNPMDRGVWRAAVHGVAKSQTWLKQLSMYTECEAKWKKGFKPDYWCCTHFSSVWFSCSVMSDSFWPHGLQHARLPCPSPTSGAYSISCRLSRWCHPTISSSVIPFSSCPQSFPASGSFQMSQVFASGNQSIGASASVLLMSIQGWFSLGLTGLISLHPRNSQESSPAPQFKNINSPALYLLYGPPLMTAWLLDITSL